VRISTIKSFDGLQRFVSVSRFGGDPARNYDVLDVSQKLWQAWFDGEEDFEAYMAENPDGFRVYQDGDNFLAEWER